MARQVASTWRWRHDLEATAQLKLDLHDALGRLLTRCYDMARSADPSCASYWTAEATYWEQQYREAMVLMNHMVPMAGHGEAPVVLAKANSSTEQARLQAALLAAFDEPALRQLARYELGIDLDAIARSGDLEERVFDLVGWSVRTNRVADLIAGAQRQNPTNTELRALS